MAAEEVPGSPLPASVLDPLRRYLDEDEDGSALYAACAALAVARVDVTGLLAWVQAYDAETPRRQRARAGLRAALGLPLIPGPPCRTA